jgi:hypothetical protein
MKIFQQDEIEEAEAYAMDGGQALHLHRIIVDRDKAPACFVRAIERGESIAHLFDQDRIRLIRTARHLGVSFIVVEHPGKPGQHVDLCGAPLQKAIKNAELPGQLRFRFDEDM